MSAAEVHHLPRRLDAGSLARDHVCSTLNGRLSNDALTDVLLVVSELVTNAVEHGQGRIELRLEFDDEHVRGEVADEGRGFDAHAQRQPFASAGHGGLLIVGQLAESWGVYDRTARVWFVIGCQAQWDVRITTAALLDVGAS
jgi:anti-sigma regulatory factor (Ser/Thr protein kinase)